MRVTAIAAEAPPNAVRRHLIGLTALLTVLTVLHDLDHLRQGRGLPAVLYLVAVGALASLALTGSVLLRYAVWARPVAAAQGLATVVGVGAVHATPQWSRFTDSYAAARTDLVSWLIIVGMMTVGAAIAVVAVLARR